MAYLLWLKSFKCSKTCCIIMMYLVGFFTWKKYKLLLARRSNWLSNLKCQISCCLSPNIFFTHIFPCIFFSCLIERGKSKLTVIILSLSVSPWSSIAAALFWSSCIRPWILSHIKCSWWFCPFSNMKWTFSSLVIFFSLSVFLRSQSHSSFLFKILSFRKFW